MDKAYVRMQYSYILNSIDHIFPKARAEIFRLLFSEPEGKLHLRDLARLSGLAVGTIQRETANLSDAGLITEERDGNRLYFKANTANPIFPELHGIALKTTGLREQLAAALNGLDGIDLAFVYGSYAQGKAGSESDIDLFVIGDVGLRHLAPKLRQIADRMNREINPSVMSAASYLDKLGSGDAYIRNVTKGNKLWIVGSDDELAAMA
ncbi:MAG: nucleotidyltransferase domain-containing protein [Opitutales bacterium]|nr:nucleotidyltransferase domain-containing protein [Opitutales bacterium]